MTPSPEHPAADIRAGEPFGTVEGGVPLPESMKDMPLIAAHGVSAAQGQGLAISHHRSFLRAEDRRIQYQRINKDRGEFVEYVTREDDEKPGYVVVQVSRV